MTAPAGAQPWLVYVLTDEARRRFSISMAKDAEARAMRHREGLGGAGQTPLLVLAEPFADRHTAVLRMQRLRRWKVAELRKLIEASNPQWADLATEQT